VVDAGDFIATGGHINQIRTQYLIHGFKLLGYDAVNLGEMDLQYGTQFLLDLKKEYQIPFVSANIVYAANQKYFVEPFFIKQISVGSNHIKIGILGLVMGDLKLPVEEKELLIVAEPLEVAQRIVPELKEQCDLIVALSHLGASQNKKLAKTVPGIDVIISGHGYSVYTEPLKVDETIIVQGRNKGQYLHYLTLNLRADQIESYASFSQKLDDSVEDAPEIVRLVSDYKEARREFLVHMKQQ